jgi:hypothetical protein
VLARAEVPPVPYAPPVGFTPPVAVITLPPVLISPPELRPPVAPLAALVSPPVALRPAEASVVPVDAPPACDVAAPPVVLALFPVSVFGPCSELEQDAQSEQTTTIPRLIRFMQLS